MVKKYTHIKTRNFRVYNKSSEIMNELREGSIDLVITSPPYNIGTKYGQFNDSSSFQDYLKLLINVIQESYRVLTPKGKLVVEVADSIVIGGNYVQLAGLFQSLCTKEGYSLIRRDVNFIKTKDYAELPDHGFDEDYSTKQNGHSNCHQILTFSKDKNAAFEGGDVLYLDYEESSEHPCPFPKKTLDFILNKNFEQGKSVLDPFMGTANLGREVLIRGGTFLGYEIDESFYQKAGEKLNQVIHEMELK